MRIVMHELDHCPNCKVMTRLIENRFGDEVEVEHRVMDDDEVDDFMSMGFMSSPIVEVEGEYHAASSKEDRDNLLETLQILHDHSNA